MTSQTLEERVEELEGLVARLYRRFGCIHGTLGHDAHGRTETCEKCIERARDWMRSRMESHP